MKQTKLFLTLLMLCGLAGTGWGQTQIYVEDFEDATINYTPSVAEFTDGSNDFFTRTGAGRSISGGYSVTNTQGSEYFAGQDLDGEGASLPINLTTNSISITNFTNLEFRVYLAEDDDGSKQDWDASDYLQITYSIDGGADQDLLWVESSQSGTNSEPSIDTDFDGTGDGTAITDAFVQFTESISGTGNTLTIDFEFDLNSGDEDIAIDHIEVYGTSASGVANPTTFTATTNSASQIDLAYDDNAAGDNVVIVFDTDNTFTTPTDGNAPAAVGQQFAGGEVLFNGNGSGTYNHTSLTAGTQYFYSAWSVDGSNDYSGGLTDDATTLKAEPDNHVSSFTATANGSNEIDLSWSDNNGTVAADGFLIVGKTGSVSFASPTDGTAISDDTDWSDDEFEVNVNPGDESYTVTGLDPSTSYDFEIYPYTNSGSNIDYKTGGTVPSANASTNALSTTPLPYSQDYTGQDGKGKDGTSAVDLSGVNWTVDVSIGGFSAASDFFAVKNGVFEGQDVDGSVTWTSQAINLNNTSNLEFSFDAKAATGVFESDDVFDVEFIIDGGTPITLFSASENAKDLEFNGTQLTTTLSTFTTPIGSTGNTGEIRITVDNNAGSEFVGWDNLSVAVSTIKAEPTNHVASFTASANGSSEIDLSWTDNNGAVVADGFLIVGKTGSASFASPTDGTAINDDTDWNNNEFEVNVNSGDESYTVTGLDPSTSYDFEIYPYTNSGGNIDYKTGGTVPSANASTNAPTPLVAIVNEMSQGSGGNKEWMEIVVIQDNLDITGWEVGDNDDGTFDSFLTFSNDPEWQSVRSGTVIAIYNSGDVDGTITADTDFSDYEVVIADNNATYFSGSWGSFGNGDDDDAAAIRDDAGNMIHDMAATHPSATINAPGSGQVTSYTGNTAFQSDLEDPSNWSTQGSTNGTPGSPNGGANSTYINSLQPSTFIFDNGSWTPQTPAGNSTSDDDVIIEAGESFTINGSVDAHDLSIAAGASLTLSSGEYLSLAGSIQNNGTLTIEDDASLVQTSTGADNNTNNGTYQIYRDQQGTVQDHHRFSYWSSPVSDESMLEVFGNSKTNTAPAHGSGGATNPDDWFSYDEGNASWAGVSPSSSTMDAARGYITTGAAGQTSSFNPSPRVFEEAAVHNGPISFTPQGMSTNNTDDQYILVGNPYPSAIDNAQFKAANSGLSGTLYFWNHLTAPTGFNGNGNNNAGDYASWNNTGSAAGNGGKTPNGTVATGQGFFVSVSAGDAIPSNIDFTNDMRVTGNNNQFFKHGKTGNRQRLWLSAQSDSGHFNEILIGLLPQASMDFDRGYDAVKLKGNPHLAFYSVLRNRDLIIQALNQDMKNDKTIPLGLDAGQTGQYTIALDSLDNWPGHSIALLDKDQDVIIDLQHNDYHFAVNQPGAIRGRFYLLISSQPFVGIEEENARSGELLYFQRGESLIVDSRLQNSPLEAVTLRSVSGRTVRQATPGTLRYELSVSDLPQGVYLLETHNQAGATTHHKVYLK